MYVIENNEEIHITNSKRVIGKKIVVDILEQHGFTLEGNTAVSKEGKEVDNTSFLKEVGNKDFYKVKEVYSWLGY